MNQHLQGFRAFLPHSNLMDLLAWRFLRSHGVKAMAHWEASPFFTKDGQDVVKATGPHIVSEGWERVTAKETGGASSGGGMVASLAAPLGVVPVMGDGSSGSLPHWQKAFLLLVGGLVVFYIRRLLRSTRRPQRAAVSEVGARARTNGSCKQPRTPSLHRAPGRAHLHWPVHPLLTSSSRRHRASDRRGRTSTSRSVQSHKAKGAASVFKRATRRRVCKPNLARSSGPRSRLRSRC